MKKYFYLLIIILMIVGCSKKETIKVEESTPVVEETTTSLAMVGDVLIHSALYQDAKVGNGYDFKPMVENTKELISKHDLAFYNQETILGGSELGVSSYPRFNSPYEVGDAMIDMGFNMVSLANNHSFDRGEAAILNSLDYWDTKKDVLTAGTYRSEEERVKEVILKKDNLTYAMLAYTTLTNGLNTPSGKEYLVNVYDYNKVKADINRLRSKVDVLLVSMHWGVEYTHEPTSEQITIANELSKLDVDIIIGHHPHVIQPITFIDNTLVIYSLGNFLSGQVGEEKEIGVMVSVDINKKEVNGVVNEITLSNIGTELIYTKADCIYSEKYSNYVCNNYKLYPFYKLNDSILPNHLKIRDKYNDILTNMNKDIDIDKYSY